MGRSKEARIDQCVVQTLRRIEAEQGSDGLYQQQPERILDRIRRSPLLMSDLPDADDDADVLIKASLKRLAQRGYITQEIKHAEQQGVTLWTITVATDIPNMNC